MVSLQEPRTNDVANAAWKPRSALVGTLLANRYRVAGLIGQGSTGAVFRADDVLMHRPVAVRVLVPALAQQPALVARIRSNIERQGQRDQEATVNLVDITDVGMTLEGELFVVTDFLDGEHLSTMLARGGRLPWSRARSLLVRIAQILGGFHEQGIVVGTLQARHCYAVRTRAKQQAIKVLHNPILEHLAGAIGPGSGHGAAMLARYIAPEQACGEPTDGRTDVYSFGVIAYELLTGVLPFTDTNPIRLVSMHLQKPPPSPRAVAPDAEIPLAVEQILLKCLAKAPDDRFASMEALTDALNAVAESASDPASATPVVAASAAPASAALLAPSASISATQSDASASPLAASATSSPLAASASSTLTASPTPSPLAASASTSPTDASAAPSLASSALPTSAPAASAAPSSLASPALPTSAPAASVAPPVTPAAPSAPLPAAPPTLGGSISETGKLRLPPPPSLGRPATLPPLGGGIPTPVPRPPSIGIGAALPRPPTLAPGSIVLRPPSIPAPAAPSLGSLPASPTGTLLGTPVAPVPSVTPAAPVPSAAQTAAEIPAAPAPSAAELPAAPAASLTPAAALSATAAPVSSDTPAAPAAPVSSDTPTPTAAPVSSDTPAATAAPVSSDTLTAAPAPSTAPLAPPVAVETPSRAPGEGQVTDSARIRTRIAAFSEDEARRGPPTKNPLRASKLTTAPAATTPPAGPTAAPVDAAPATATTATAAPAAAAPAAPELRIVPAQPAEPALAPAANDSLSDAEAPRSRTGWLVGGIVGLLAAAGVAVLVLTSPSFTGEDTKNPAKAPARMASAIGEIPQPAKSTPTKIAEASTPALPERGTAVDPPSDTPPTGDAPPASDTPPPGDTPPTGDAPATPTSAVAAVEDTPASKKKDPKNKKKRRTRSPEDDEPREKDVFDQLREHMEAKKAAEAAYAKAAEAANAPRPQPAPAPAPAPAPPKSDDDKARETLDRARQASSAGNPSLAYSLAKQSYNLNKTQDALELMGVSACRARNADNARSAFNSLSGSRRTAVASACNQSGITL